MPKIKNRKVEVVMLREILECEVKENKNLVTIGLPKIIVIDDPVDFEIQLKSEMNTCNSIGYMAGEVLYVGESKFIPIQFYTLRNKPKRLTVGIEFEAYDKDGYEIMDEELWAHELIEVETGLEKEKYREVIGKKIFEMDFGKKIPNGYFEIEEEMKKEN